MSKLSATVISDSDTSIKTKIEPNINVSPPSMYKVVYVNDDVTTMMFVIESLMSIFNHSYDSAVNLTEKVHVEGSAVAAILPYEMAQQKGLEVTQLASANGFPLVIKLEADD